MQNEGKQKGKREVLNDGVAKYNRYVKYHEFEQAPLGLSSDLLNNTKKAQADMVLFNRVPKVGSQSFMALLYILAKINGFVHIPSEGKTSEQILMDPKTQLSKITELLTKDKPYVYTQHMAYINFTRYHMPKPIYINLVRDPIERIVSWHYYIRADWYYKDMQRIFGDKAPATPPKEFMEMDLDTCVRTNNVHCRFNQMEIHDSSSDHRRQTLFFCGQNKKLCLPFNSKAAMQMAKKTVEEDYAVVGSWEDADITLTVLEHYIPRYFRNAKVAYYLNFPKVSKTNKNNTTRQISDETREILRRNLTQEFEFYHFCKQRLYLQYAAIQDEKRIHDDDDYLLLPEHNPEEDRHRRKVNFNENGNAHKHAIDHQDYRSDNHHRHHHNQNLVHQAEPASDEHKTKNRSILQRKNIVKPEENKKVAEDYYDDDDENDDDDDSINFKADLLNNTKKAEIDVVFFNRVPKVGSQSLMELMAKLTSINGFIHARDKGKAHETIMLKPDKQLELISDLLSRNKPHVYSQHIAYINFTRFHMPKPIYINLVRDPIERIISWHYYIRAPWYYRDLKAKLGDKAPPTPSPEFMEMDLDTCIRTNDIHCQFNQMEINNRAGDHRRQILFFCGQNRKLCMPFNSQAAMQKAKRTVEEDYAVVGSWEDANITLAVLEHYIPKFFKNAKVAYYLNHDRLSKVNRNNVTRVVSDESRLILRKNFTHEIEFYEFCKQRLYLQYAAINDGYQLDNDDYLLIPDHNEEDEDAIY